MELPQLLNEEWACPRCQAPVNERNEFDPLKTQDILVLECSGCTWGERYIV